MQRVLEAVEEECPVWQLGEHVMEGPVFHLQFDSLAGRDVEEHVSEAGPPFDRGERDALLHVMNGVVDDDADLEGRWRTRVSASCERSNDHVHVLGMDVCHQVVEALDVSEAVDGLLIAERHVAVGQVGLQHVGMDAVEQVLESLTRR
jgi:hypothetical protein